MPKLELEKVDMMEAKLMDEISTNNKRYEELVIYFAEESQPLLPQSTQIIMKPDTKGLVVQNYHPKLLIPGSIN